MSERIRLGIEMGVDPLRMLDVYFHTDDVAVEAGAFTLLSAMLGFMRGVEPAVTIASAPFIDDQAQMLEDLNTLTDALRTLRYQVAQPIPSDPFTLHLLVPKVDADCDGLDDLHATLRKLRPYTPDPGAGDQ